MFLSTSRSLKIKKKCSWTSHMLLGLPTIIWWPSLGHTGPCTSRIMQWKILHLFPIPRLRWILPAPIVVRRSPCLAAFCAYIFCAVVQKRWYPKRSSKSFCWIINRHKWNGDYTHQLIGFFRFPADVAKHCPHYIKPAFIVSCRLWYPPFRQPWMGPASHRYVFFGHWATLKGETLESGMCD